jgi:predicted DNA-binding transcriptional regulator AlpA
MPPEVDFSNDEDLWTLAQTCAFFGGSTKPIHASTLWRGVKAGRYPKPILTGPNMRRWLPSECRVARQAQIEARAA